jgi:hypothetical protein
MKKCTSIVQNKGHVFQIGLRCHYETYDNAMSGIWEFLTTCAGSKSPYEKRKKKKKGYGGNKNEATRGRTWNLLIRSQAPCPLGHSSNLVFVAFCSQ